MIKEAYRRKTSLQFMVPEALSPSWHRGASAGTRSRKLRVKNEAQIRGRKNDVQVGWICKHVKPTPSNIVLPGRPYLPKLLYPPNRDLVFKPMSLQRADSFKQPHLLGVSFSFPVSLLSPLLPSNQGWTQFLLQLCVSVNHPGT